ncbi:23S rRNA (adenine(1618)-N(6))-methyltransferase RlmF [Paludibacterium yongneupense]|uniref:23S rRNA (adenine(1618)-N(6))-methyltransferase RlmF n=1 Tax=Paludibacterium yongneupense TaxID=400061 RepID=UPI0004019421|nr:23S rRNA (adenine(1618)-N(6))-methyltransferase RlmF [Paludibacterium yongneupense]
MVTTDKRLHPRNRHQGRYDFAALIAACPALSSHVAPNAYGDDSIDFADPTAVRQLNRALLAHDYGVVGWDIPDGYLCPPIPGRADYLHYLADLLASGRKRSIPRGTAVRVLDIGVGANCVYPLIGHAEYGWRFVGSDIDDGALNSARAILAANPAMSAAIELRRQNDPNAIFDTVIRAGERFDLTLCNPPFHASRAEAGAGTRRKWQNLGRGDTRDTRLNFGGRQSELWCPGGEEAFIGRMIADSVRFADRCCWFSSLVSKAASLPALRRALKHSAVRHSTILAMAQGQKQSRVLAWTFLDAAGRRDWHSGG